LQACWGHKNNISHKKLEFSDEGRIKYEFFTRQKLKKPKNQNINLEIEF